MEKIKEFMGNPKKTAILGLVGTIPMPIYILSYLLYWLKNFEFSYIFSFLPPIAHIIGLFIYFIIVLKRFYKQNGNIKIANYILIGGYIISLAYHLISFTRYETLMFYNFLDIIALIVAILYFLNILFGKKNFVNNKVFAILCILLTILSNIGISFPCILIYISYILIVPYFYNYYKLLKNQNINAKTK